MGDLLFSICLPFLMGANLKEKKILESNFFPSRVSPLWRKKSAREASTSLLPFL